MHYICYRWYNLICVTFDMQKIFLTTKDGVKIAANLYPAESPKGWIVFSHMMPVVKESWNDLAEMFCGAGYESVAIDLRGHGESVSAETQKLNYRNFSDAEHQKSILDLETAAEFLIKERKAAADKVSFVGASIGANLSLQYISEHPEFKTAVLLSPGLDYRGVKTEPLAKNLKAGQKVFFISAKDDTRSSGNNNAEENQKLYDLIPDGAEKKIKIYANGGHGTDILGNQPELAGLIKDFICQTVLSLKP